MASRRYFDLDVLKQFTVPDLESGRQDLLDVPAMAWQHDSRNWPYYFYDVSVDEVRQCGPAYYASISFVDKQIGRLLDALEQDNLLHNTIIVFWSDHRNFPGEKGLWYNRKAFRRSARMPLIFQRQTGVRAEALISPSNSSMFSPHRRIIADLHRLKF